MARFHCHRLRLFCTQSISLVKALELQASVYLRVNVFLSLKIKSLVTIPYRPSSFMYLPQKNRKSNSVITTDIHSPKQCPTLLTGPKVMADVCHVYPKRRLSNRLRTLVHFISQLQLHPTTSQTRHRLQSNYLSTQLYKEFSPLPY